MFLEYVPALISILAEERQRSHEHVLSLLLTLVEENQTAQNECKNPQHNFKETLQNYLAIIKNKDEALVSIWCSQIKNNFFALSLQLPLP